MGEVKNADLQDMIGVTSNIRLFLSAPMAVAMSKLAA